VCAMESTAGSLPSRQVGARRLHLRASKRRIEQTISRFHPSSCESPCGFTLISSATCSLPPCSTLFPTMRQACSRRSAWHPDCRRSSANEPPIANIPERSKFIVSPVDGSGDHGHRHAPTHWRDIRCHLKEALPHAIGHQAIGIFGLIADVEARVHGVLDGVSPDDVNFHEVDALDSIADIVGAA
jgi:Protein of unknown function DUF111